MTFWSLLVLLPAQVETVESRDFPRPLQEKAISATVRLSNPVLKLQGSGVVLGQSGGHFYVLTAAHLVEKAKGLEAAAFSAASYPKPARTFTAVEVLARDRNADLAILKVLARDDPPPSLPLAGEAAGQLPMAVLSIGCAPSSPPTAWLDQALEKKKVRKPGGEVCTVWELARESAAGRSGGPLLDRRGQLIGIASGKSDGKGYATHLDEISRFLKEQRLDWLSKH